MIFKIYVNRKLYLIQNNFLLQHTGKEKIWCRNRNFTKIDFTDCIVTHKKFTFYALRIQHIFLGCSYKKWKVFIVCGKVSAVGLIFLFS